VLILQNAKEKARALQDELVVFSERPTIRDPATYQTMVAIGGGMRRQVLLGSLVLIQSLSSSYTNAYYGSSWRTSNNNNNQEIETIVDQFLEDSSASSSDSVLPSLSPRCWQSAVILIHKALDIVNADSAAALCSSLPEAHQKRFALEIAHCHMQDMGMNLYLSPATERKCTESAPTIDSELVHRCLKHLTDAGQNTYTHYITYVQVLCTRKTQEVFSQYQQNLKNEIATRYAQISTQSIAQMESMAAAMSSIASMPQLLREQLTEKFKNDMKETLQKTFDEQIKDRLDVILREQATEHATMFGNVMDKLEQRETEHLARHNEWAHYQSSMLLKQTREMERQRDALNDHRIKMESLSDAVSQTTRNIQPLVGLQSLVQAATDGYTWLTFLLYFLGTFNVVWIVTRPARCSPFRSYMYGIVMAEAVIEIVLTGAARHGFLLSDSERIECTRELRRWTVLLECMTYVFGMVSTSLFPSTDPDKSFVEPAQTTNEEFERLLDERLRNVLQRNDLVGDRDGTEQRGRDWGSSDSMTGPFHHKPVVPFRQQPQHLPRSLPPRVMQLNGRHLATSEVAEQQDDDSSVVSFILSPYDGKKTCPRRDYHRPNRTKPSYDHRPTTTMPPPSPRADQLVTARPPTVTPRTSVAAAVATATGTSIPEEVALVKVHHSVGLAASKTPNNFMAEEEEEEEQDDSMVAQQQHQEDTGSMKRPAMSAPEEEPASKKAAVAVDAAADTSPRTGELH
jgi:hypothetical protein